MTACNRIAYPKQRSSLNPRSCAASSMTQLAAGVAGGAGQSQSAFMRGFIDDFTVETFSDDDDNAVSIRVHARLHR